ncbi:MAG: hypothetical protein H7066_05305 [Cytophagaceae bacterium]|nr:hypothetical protein [Gemmatimonadaceae bacterium]
MSRDDTAVALANILPAGRGRALFLGVPLHGHVRPSRDVVSALVKRGEAVRYYAGGGFEEIVAATGAEPASYGTPVVEALPERVAELPRLSLVVMEATKAVLEADLDAFRRWEPDYVIADLLAPWGYWVAQILRVPVVASIPTFAVNRRVLVSAVRGGVHPRRLSDALAKEGAVWRANRMRRRLATQYAVQGVGPTAIVLPRAERQVVYTTRAFQPHGDSFDEQRTIFAGPCLVGDGPVTEAPDGDRVYLSLGTLFQGDGTLLDLCVRALDSGPWRVTATRGGREVSTAAGSRVEWLAFADQREQLRRASVFVTHAGLGGVQESLLAGVPMLLLPQMSEQAMVAGRVAEVGAGIVLGAKDVSVESVRRAVEQLMTEPRYRDAAMQQGVAMRRDAASHSAAEAILAFTTTRR